MSHMLPYGGDRSARWNCVVASAIVDESELRDG